MDDPIESGSKLQLRCSNGKVIHTTLDGYFDLECDDTGFITPSQWPKPEHCIVDGRKCNVADAPQ